MKICLCGSIAFFDEMLKVKKELEDLGHEVKLPPNEIENEHGKMMNVREYYRLRQDTSDEESWVWSAKERAIRCHFNKMSGMYVYDRVNFVRGRVKKIPCIIFFSELDVLKVTAFRSVFIIKI